MKDPDIAELAVGHGGGEGFKSSPTFPLQPRADFLFINRKNWFLRKDFGRRLTVGIGGLNLQRVGLSNRYAKARADFARAVKNLQN